jgi:ABC-type transport system substrate-binding protein
MQNKTWRTLLVIAVFLAACTDSSDGPQPETYVHSMDGAPASLDPGQAVSIYANFLAVNLYDTLYRYKYLARPYELTPNLAEGLPEVSADGLTVTIRIKRGVRFIDDPAFENGIGREVLASDFVHSILRHFDPASRAQGAWLWQGRIVGLDAWKEAGADYDSEVEGLRAIDDHTVQVTLTRPFPQLVHTFAQGYSAVVPPEAVAAYGLELGSRAVGSGPFRLVSFDTARAVLEKNTAFRREPFDLLAEGFDPERNGGLGLEALEGRSPPLIDRLVIEFIAEDAARWSSFISGQTGFTKVPVIQFDQVLDSRSPATLKPDLADRFHFSAAQESGFVYTNFNMADKAIGYHPDPARNERNRALRCAIIKGFDWQSRNQQFFSGTGEVFPGVITPTVPEFDAAGSRESVTFDPQAARQLLSEHGWTSETLPELTYGFPASVTERQMFEQFRSFMMDIGYPGEKVQPMTFATYGDYARAYSRREVMLITSSWTMDYPDAENTIALYYGPNGAPGSNSANYDNPRYDELFQQTAAMPFSPERTRLYREMNQLLIDDCATISGLSRTLLFLWSRDVLMQPDRSFTGGFFLRFVGLADGAP